MTTRTRLEGYLILADISGYTAFLTGSELEHAQEIMEDLITLILGHMQPPLKLVKLEGDAIFCYALGTGFLDNTRLLDVLEACYFDFADHLVAMHRATTCRCAACRAIPTLDLKFFAHYGSFLIQRLAGMEDLAGPDVILAHRLLKNQISEATGQHGYLFLTDPCLAQLGGALALPRHSEVYEHLGEVGGGIHDLKAAWQAMTDRRRAYIGPAEADVTVEYDFAVAPPVLWDYMVDPAKNVQFQSDIVAWVNQPGADGRMGQGTSFHCAHGAYATIQHYHDWRPFHYYTLSVEQTNDPPSPHGPPPMLLTWEFTPNEDHTTRCTIRGRLISRDPAILEYLPMMKEFFTQDFLNCFRRLEQILRDEAANFTPPAVELAPAAE
ncbi:MAG TPA: DUF2652 domain-containing protein [Chloroflexia bacterium]|nr:DUF2652 domain-containing protein [Chloroflexia bacterium]